MKLNKLHNAHVLLLCAALVACNKTTPVQNGTDPSGKTPITLSIGGVDSQSDATKAAVITDDPDKTYKPFDKNTKIFMVMKSTYDTSNPDFLGSRKDKYTVSRGLVTAGQTDVIFKDGSNQKYWDDAHARSSQLDIWAFAQQATWDNYTFQIPDPNWPGIEDDPNRFKEYKDNTFYGTTTYFPWEEHTVGEDPGSKGPVYPCIMVWKVTNTPWTQTATSIQYQDLMFSNNLTKHGDNPADDQRLKFNNKTSGKFDGGEMKFYHAMSKITINIIEGDGFIKEGANKDSDFQFKTGTNIKFHEGTINTQGTFNIKNGYFEKVDNQEEITSIALTSPKESDPNPYYILQALAIPNIDGINGQTDEYSRFVQNNATVVMEFTIDNNTYKITSNDLYAALHGKTGATETTTGIIPLEAGKNYVFTFKISKTKVGSITAQIADWESVTAERQEPSNARISLRLEERGNHLEEDDVVDMYRTANESSTISDSFESYDWTTGYTASGNKNIYSHASGSWGLSNLWFWPNNETFYHFRAVMPSGTTVSTDSTPDPDVDYFAINSADASSCIDYRWGATMLDDTDDGDPGVAGSFKWFYGAESKGFDSKDDGTVAAGLPAGTQHQIYKAIGPTTGTIKFVLFHMMSDLTINITTTTGSDAVELGDGSSNKTQVFIEDASLGGKVLLGNGLVQTTDGTTDSQEVSQSSFTEAVVEPAKAAVAQYKYGIVPQNLATSVNSNNGVQLRIVTPDNNQYFVNLKDAKATIDNTNSIANPYQKVGGTGADKDKYLLNRWYPGFRYVYNLTLKKSGILDLTATIVDWERVEATYDDVTIQ